MAVKEFSRRGFLELGAAAGAAILAASQRVHAAGSDVLKVGLVGCGGRGRGSLFDSLTAMPNVRVVALGDLAEYGELPNLDQASRRRLRQGRAAGQPSAGRRLRQRRAGKRRL